MTMEIHNDERDWEPGGIYYDGPYYTPEEDNEDEDLDTYEAEHDYDDEEAYAADGSSEHFKRFALEQAIPVLADRERAFYETIG